MAESEESLLRGRSPREEEPPPPPLRGGESAPEHVQSARRRADGGCGCGGPSSSLAEEQRRRRRMLEEYLAAKRGRAPLKERASQPPKPARGPGAALRPGTMGPPAQTPSGPTPCTLAPKAPLPLRSEAARKGQKRPQGVPGGAPKAVAPKQGPPGRPGGGGPSGKPGRREGAQRRLSGHGRRGKAEGEKENAGVRPGQKRTGATFGPPPAPEGPAKKGRPALERGAPGNGRARPGWAPAPQTPARPREPAPRASGGLGPFPAPDRPTAVSRPSAKGPGASGVQRSGASGGLLAGRGAPSARGASGGPPKGWPQQQKQPPGRCLAHHPRGRQPRTPKASPARGRPTAQRRSTAERRQRSPGFKRLPRPPQAKPGPPVSAGHAAPRGRRGSLKSRQTAVGPGQVLKTPSAQDQRKLLEVWLASRGKCYKRPPMVSSAPKPPKHGKASLNHSFWGSMEKEEEKKEQLHVASEIMRTLTECRKMAEEGFPPEELLAVLSRIPEVEKFAQFWICKAMLQAQQGPLDVAGLYEAAVCAGAVPLQELRDAIAGILKTASDPARAQPDHASVLLEEEEEEEAAVSRSFCQEGLPWPQPRSAIKFQILPLPRAKEVKLLTPVRRSLRIERAAASYPQMLKDHDLVVSSLEEITATDHRSQFVFRNNEALPGRVEVASFLTGLATPAKWPH